MNSTPTQFNPLKSLGIKNWVATHNTTFKLKDVEELTTRKFNEVSVETWQNVCRNDVNVEKNFIEKEHLFDDAMDHLEFAVNTGSSDEEWESEDDVDMSGVVPLDSDSE
ncbi:hypothetical protein MTP99_006759 [Tenebrio molitor]|nr:hypothetical protein MTP99_006759 [Tenebrio molitor]